MASVRSSTHQPSPEFSSGSERNFRSLHQIQEVIDGLAEQVALIERDGTIVAVNETWRRMVERRARTGLLISRDYLAFLRELIDDGDEGAEPILRAFLDVSAGTRRTFRYIYKGQGAFDGFDFNVIIAAVTVGETDYLLVSVHDVSELVFLKRQRRRIGGELLRAHDRERRRIARELHDSTSQMLVVLQSRLAQLSGRAGAAGDEIIDECKDAVQEIHREIRTFSFLAHPPELTGDNLSTALEDLVRGFAVRVGLGIDTDIVSCGEVSASVEAALYRIAQEALANIHRHAAAKHVAVRLVSRERYLHLVISDDGIGMKPVNNGRRRSFGVGIMGMGERVRELGGRLSIDRAESGTTLTVSLPRTKRMVFAGEGK